MYICRSRTIVTLKCHRKLCFVVVNTLLVDNFASIFDGIMVGRVSD